MSLAKATQSMISAREQLQSATFATRSVFISYDRDDVALVEQLTDMLALHGYVPWRDNQIKVGDFFEARILEALDAAMAAIVLWTPRSITSQWVKWEAGQALKRNKLIPLATPDLDHRDIRPPFNDLNTLPFGDDDALLGVLKASAAPPDAERPATVRSAAKRRSPRQASA
jgi:hypothetical protein